MINNFKDTNNNKSSIDNLLENKDDYKLYIIQSCL